MWAGAVAAVVLLSALASVVSREPWPLIFSVILATSAVHARHAGWRASVSLTLLAALVLEVSFAWFAPHLPGSFARDNYVAWTLAGLAAVPFAAAWGAPRVSRRQVVDAVAIMLAPAVVLGYLAWTAVTRAQPWLGWNMAGDAANNMILVRELVDAGGLLRSQGNPAPMSSVLYGAWSAPGLADASAAEAVRHMVFNGGQLTLLLGALLGVLTSLLALRRAPESTAARVAVGFTAGMLPWLWCVMGISFRQGFQNAAPAMLVLLLGWTCWTMHRRHPVVAVTGLILATWAAATVWAPVLVVPGCWLVGAAVVEARALRRSGRALLLPLAALAAAGTYAVLVTLRDLRATGGVPGMDGAVPLYSPDWSLRVAVVLLVLSVVCYRWMPREDAWGYWLALPGIGLALYSLIGARLDADLPYWGYYPIKFTWIVMATGMLILFSVLQPAASWLARRLWRGNGVLLAFAACVATMFWTTPPLRPATLQSLMTPVYLHDDVGYDRAYASMLRLMEEDPKTIVAQYAPKGAPPGFDGVINFWLLQSGSADLNDPLRFPAYSMNSADPAAVCSAIIIWGGDVRIATRDPQFEKQLDKACPDTEFTVDLVTGR